MPISVVRQGRVFEIVDKRDHTPPGDEEKTDAPTRGVVRSFSRASRRRLIDMFQRLEMRGASCKFLTLTYAGCPSHERAYADLRAFLERLRRKHPEASAVWRKELQERGSIHFHLIVYNMPFYEQRKLQSVWTDVTGEELSIVHIRAVYNDKHATAYVSKYVAKMPDESEASLDSGSYPHANNGSSSGRWWGVHNRDALPFAQRHEFWITSADHTRYIAWWMQQRYGSPANKYVLSRKLYTDDAAKWYMWAMNIEKPLRKPFLKEWRHERHFKDRPFTVLVPFRPEVVWKGPALVVGESDVRAKMDAGRSRQAVLLSVLSN